MDYLGNKRAISDRVVAAIEGGWGGASGIRVLDAFSGTAAVSAALRARGHRVLANDNLEVCAAWARAALLVSAHPPFAGVQALLGLEEGEAPYAGVVAHLNDLPGAEGFAARNFSPASVESCGVERRYLTYENALLVDSIRAKIETWRPLLSDGEHGLLLATLVDAVMRVSNTAGTYGCYLKRWKRCALDPLTLQSRSLPDHDRFGHRVTCDDAIAVAAEGDVDVLYADPPYTKRQYAAYYHVLETIVRNDEPPLAGSTGLRPWQSHASDWCYKRRAPAALEALLKKSSAERVVLSYSEDGQIDHSTLLDLLGAHGSVSFEEFGLRRYRSSQLAHKGDIVTERIYTLERR